jgi:hypothetical protein
VPVDALTDEVLDDFDLLVAVVLLDRSLQMISAPPLPGCLQRAGVIDSELVRRALRYHRDP